MYQFQFLPPDEQHLHPTRLQVQEHHLREQKLRYQQHAQEPHQIVLPPIVEAIRTKLGHLLIQLGTLLAGSRTAGAHGPALAAPR